MSGDDRFHLLSSRKKPINPMATASLTRPNTAKPVSAHQQLRRTFWGSPKFSSGWMHPRFRGEPILAPRPTHARKLLGSTLSTQDLLQISPFADALGAPVSVRPNTTSGGGRGVATAGRNKRIVIGMRKPVKNPILESHSALLRFAPMLHRRTFNATTAAANKQPTETKKGGVIEWLEGEGVNKHSSDALRSLAILPGPGFGRHVNAKCRPERADVQEAKKRKEDANFLLGLGLSLGMANSLGKSAKQPEDPPARHPPAEKKPRNKLIMGDFGMMTHLSGYCPSLVVSVIKSVNPREEDIVEITSDVNQLFNFMHKKK